MKKNMHRNIICLSGFVVFGILAVGSVDTETRTERTQETNIPNDVSFSIIDSDTFLNYRRSLTVRLNKRVSEQVLRAIALHLKDLDRRTYDRTFITYYLPGMDPNDRAWATTHFNPDLEVLILGSTTGQKRNLATQPYPADRQIIGSWLDELMESRVTFFRDGDKIFMERMFTSGSSRIEEVAERDGWSGRRFDKIEGPSDGDHYVIDSDGNLQIRDNEGFIRSLTTILRQPLRETLRRERRESSARLSEGATLYQVQRQYGEGRRTKHLVIDGKKHSGYVFEFEPGHHLENFILEAEFVDEYLTSWNWRQIAYSLPPPDSDLDVDLGPKPSEIDELRSMAWLQAQTHVKRHLVSPRTASFSEGWFSGQSYTQTVTHLGGYRFRVSGWVDSENVFGATIRNNFTCVFEVKRDPITNNRTWYVEDFSFN